MPHRTTVIGFGNTLKGDDAIGMLVIGSLRERTGIDDDEFHPTEGTEREFKLVEGGNDPFLLPQTMEVSDTIVIVDAARYDGVPGEVRQFVMDELGHVPVESWSMHGITVQDAFQLGRSFGYTSRVILVGVCLVSTDIGTDPTPEVMESLDTAVEMVLTLLRE